MVNSIYNIPGEKKMIGGLRDKIKELPTFSIGQFGSPKNLTVRRDHVLLLLDGAEKDLQRKVKRLQDELLAGLPKELVDWCVTVVDRWYEMEIL